MRKAIVYCSQSGFTKKYADWLSEDLGCPATPYASRGQLNLQELDLLVFCSWFHAAAIKGSKWVKEVMAQHPGLKVVVLATGASAMPGDPFSTKGEVEEAFHRTFNPQEYPNLPWFYCRGGFEFSKLGVADKVAMRMFFHVNGKKAEHDPILAQMLQTMEEGFDGTDRAYLAPVLSHIQQLE